MLRTLTTTLRQNFAFNFFKRILQKPKEKTYQETIQQSSNLGFIIKQIKQKNLTKPKLLPHKQDKKLTIVTELDETLLYSFTPDEDGYLLAPLRKYDFYHEFPQYNAYLSIYKRRGLQQFLDYILMNHELVVWTTGVKSYSDILLQHMDPQNKIQYKFNQQHCDRIVYQKDQIDQYVKDLNLLGRDLKRVLYLDSRAFSYWMYPSNCFPIQQFKADNTNANEDLVPLIEDIQKMRNMEDIRPYLSETYMIQSMLRDSKLI